MAAVSLPPVAIDPSMKERAIQLYREGSKTDEITRMTGVSRSTLYYLLQAEGETPDRLPRRRASDGPPPHDDPELLAWALDRIGALEAEVAVLKERLRIARDVLGS